MGLHPSPHVPLPLQPWGHDPTPPQRWLEPWRHQVPSLQQQSRSNPVDELQAALSPAAAFPSVSAAGAAAPSGSAPLPQQAL